MKLAVSAVIACGLCTVTGLAQFGSQDAFEPSPMEAFAERPGAHTAWSSEIGRLENGDEVATWQRADGMWIPARGRLATDGTRAVVTALVLENAAESAPKIRGVRIDLFGKEATDRIYLDEEASRRTIKALQSIADGVKRGIAASGCYGAAEFWPLYRWPWNKYHELDAEVCASDLTLIGRHKPALFRFYQQGPERLSALLGTALDRLKDR